MGCHDQVTSQTLVYDPVLGWGAQLGGFGLQAPSLEILLAGLRQFTPWPIEPWTISQQQASGFWVATRAS